MNSPTITPIDFSSAHIQQTIKLLKAAASDHQPTALATAFGAESVVLIHLIAELKLNISTFSLDTGRLPEQTYQVAAEIQQRYPITIDWYFPEAASIEQLNRERGPNSFRDSVENRQHCCSLRKVLPLQRALAGKRGWLSGQRHAHSAERANLLATSWDPNRQLTKILPLLTWTDDQVWEFIHTHNIPYNSLYDQGYSSIGCAPCSRATTAGEDSRAGRWWWEQQTNKECGIHADYFSGGSGI
ncbi:MAG: phosphoadenylyl-sulfate reductase [Immundisolibacteraceae bacterium]|nr:phosphoadenylyl-sulfate reductase [Immundisolibacteraceae bacterium]